MRIGIIAAMRHEMEMILDRMDDAREEYLIGYTFFVGKINDNDIVICESGVGKVNAGCAAALLISEFQVNLVINTGIAGGLPGVKHRDVIIANGLIWHDFDIRIFGYDYGQVPHMPRVYLVNPALIALTKAALIRNKIDYKEGVIASGDQFVNSIDKLEFVMDTKPLACEMEGCAIAQVATKAGVDFIVLRYISDILGEENQNENYLEFEEEMATRSANICISLLESIEG